LWFCPASLGSLLRPHGAKFDPAQCLRGWTAGPPPRALFLFCFWSRNLPPAPPIPRPTPGNWPPADGRFSPRFPMPVPPPVEAGFFCPESQVWGNGDFEPSTKDKPIDLASRHPAAPCQPDKGVPPPPPPPAPARGARRATGRHAGPPSRAARRLLRRFGSFPPAATPPPPRFRRNSGGGCAWLGGFGWGVTLGGGGGGVRFGRGAQFLRALNLLYLRGFPRPFLARRFVRPLGLTRGKTTKFHPSKP